MTTIVSAQPLLDAIAAGLTARGVTFGDGAKPTVVGTKPWVVGWLGGGSYGAKSLLGGDAWSADLTAHCVGLAAASARVAAAKLADTLYDLHRDVVGGRLVQFPEQLADLPVSRDDDADPPIYVAIVEWRLRTSPA